MDLAGDEKRIRALFSELSLAEAQAAPRFEKLWREALLAQQTPHFAQRVPHFSKSPAMVAATLVVAVAVLFGAWLSYKSPEQNAHTVAPGALPAESRIVETVASRQAPDVREPANRAIVRRPAQNRRRTLARWRQQSERALQQQAAMLAVWRSPTANFMTSPTPSGFNSLPELNQSVKDLESFLPKESNQ